MRTYLLLLIIWIASELVCYSQESRINYNGQKIFLSGINLAWINFSEDVTNLNKCKYTRAINQVKNSGGNSIRWWLHVNGKHSPSFKNDSVSYITEKELDNLEKAFDIAYENGIAVIPCLWSFDMLRMHEEDGSVALKDEILNRNELLLTNEKYTNAYFNNWLIPMLKKLGNHPAVLCWEIFNEPEGMSVEHGWRFTRHIPMSSIQKFINLSSGIIHRYVPGIMVSNGSWSFIASTDIGKYKNFYSDSELIKAGGDSLGVLDFYMVHYYDWGGTEISPFHHPASYWNLDKPIVIAEFAAHGPFKGIDPVQAFEYLYNNGYAGGLAWSWSGDFGGLKPSKEGIKNLSTQYGKDIFIRPKTGN